MTSDGATFRGKLVMQVEQGDWRKLWKWEERRGKRKREEEEEEEEPDEEGGASSSHIPMSPNHDKTEDGIRRWGATWAEWERSIRQRAWVLSSE